MKLLNFKLIRYIFGLLLLMESVFMLVATGVAAYYNYKTADHDLWALLLPSLMAAGTGYLLMRSGRNHSERFTQKEGFLIVAAAWIVFSLFGMLPYLMSGAVHSVADAFFETMSGFTTTGATVLDNIDSLPHGILFWRSMTQWLGGLGIVVFSLALMPLIGSGATQMFNAEVSGLGVDKLRPKIQNTARQLWSIYVGLTLLCATLFWMGPMDTFDATCHALTTMASGGFSTHQSSIGYYASAYIEYVCAIFMFITSINYSLFYLVGVGKWRQFWRNEEFRWMVFVVAGAVVLFVILETCVKTFATLTPEQADSMGTGFADTLRTAVFHTITILSSTGYQGQYADYVTWGAIFWIPTLVLMAIGGCAGSTAGGIKVIRTVVLMKNTKNEFLMQVHPRSITTVRVNGHSIATETVSKVLAFLFIYLLLIIVGVFFLQCLGLSFDTAIGTTVSAFGNCGPGLGSTGPATTWAMVPSIGKWFLSLAMLIGRLEIFTVIILFTSTFWKK